MAFLSIIRDFFESLFGGSLPEVKIKHGLRQIESALKNQQPLLYKNGMVQPNFAEALHVLYAATRSFKSVLAETLMSSDVRIRGRYTEQLFFTNLREEDKSLYNALSYENRRQEALDSGNASKTYDEQRRKMDKFLACFSSPEFAKIDIVSNVLILSLMKMYLNISLYFSQCRLIRSPQSLRIFTILRPILF